MSRGLTHKEETTRRRERYRDLYLGTGHRPGTFHLQADRAGARQAHGGQEQTGLGNVIHRSFAQIGENPAEAGRGITPTALWELLFQSSPLRPASQDRDGAERVGRGLVSQ